MEPVIIERNSRNQLTAYALSCGYQQRWNDSKPGYLRDVSLTLWEEHGVYHVRAHDFAEKGRLFWNSFRTLTEARKGYSSSKRELRKMYLPH